MRASENYAKAANALEWLFVEYDTRQCVLADPRQLS